VSVFERTRARDDDDDDDDDEDDEDDDENDAAARNNDGDDFPHRFRGRRRVASALAVDIFSS